MIKPSKYNHFGKVGEDKNILFNLATSSVALFNDREIEQVLSASFCDMNLEMVALQNGFVVPSEEDEVEKVLSIERMNNYSSRFAGFQILPTTACNARCWYCYEEGFAKQSMTDECIEAIPGFIGSYMEMVDDVHVTWFGGEPLLGFDAMCKLSDALVASCEAAGVGYTSDIITNATLITPETARTLIERCKIGQAQITLDGIGKTHVARKRYVDAAITFDSIIQAMDILAESGMLLLIRLNIDKENTEDLFRLIELLGNKWAQKENVMLYVAPLYGNSSKAVYSEHELNELYRIIFKKMIDAGWIQSFDGLPMNFNNASCSARMINNFVIAPSGDVYKCEHLLSCECERVGTVFDGVVYNEPMKRWASPCEPDKCLECSYLPSCHGGCYAAEALDFGFGRCPHIAFITEAIVDAAGYLLRKREKGNKNDFASN